jgi:hypothetical protein
LLQPAPPLESPGANSPSASQVDLIEMM